MQVPFVDLLDFLVPLRAACSSLRVFFFFPLFTRASEAMMLTMSSRMASRFSSSLATTTKNQTESIEVKVKSTYGWDGAKAEDHLIHAGYLGY